MASYSLKNSDSFEFVGRIDISFQSTFGGQRSDFIISEGF
jgi:hypothetical protein